MEESIRRMAERFREALEAGGLLTASLRDFPHGACSDASDLLADYLDLHGLARWTLRRGWRGGHSHAWLGLDDLIVDITADQFDEVDASVLIVRESEWHNCFVQEASRPAGLDGTSGPALPGLRKDFALLVARADSSLRS